MSNSIYGLLLISIMAIAVSSCNGDVFSQSNVSNIKADETVVFFRTSAWQDNKSGDWHIPIHGWIYEPQHSTERKQVFAAVLKEKYGLTLDKQSEKYFDSRLNLIIADNERGKQNDTQL